jgi:hypothetical protein
MYKIILMYVCIMNEERERERETHHHIIIINNC